MTISKGVGIVLDSGQRMMLRVRFNAGSLQSLLYWHGAWNEFADAGWKADVDREWEALGDHQIRTVQCVNMLRGH